jgi:predicted dehydrogenase
VQVTAGHNYQFTLEMLDMRRLVQEGYLGGAPVHLECHWSYDLGDASYVGPIVSSRRHWVRQLPGQLLQNVISHGIARLAEFLGDDVVVHAIGHQSAQLRRLGGEEVIDELRVLLRDASGVTASFCFSTQLKPGMNQLRICGPANALLVDQVSGSLICHANASDKSYLTYVRPPLRVASQHVRNAVRNVRRFARRELYQDGGVKELISRFYDSIRTGGPPPIPYREILLTARIMDTVFEQVYERGVAPVASAERRLG